MMTDVGVFASQSRYSAPGRHGDRFDALSGDVAGLCAASRNVIAHYRAELPELDEHRRGEIDSRWLDVILDIDLERHPDDLTVPRERTQRVAGCCRDHCLFVVGALRHEGVPARNRVGFAHYFTPEWATDHVVVEYWRKGRWVRIDPELAPGADVGFDPSDIPAGAGAPFETAATAWLGWRGGDRDLSTYGVHGVPDLNGPRFVATYVVYEVAHRYGDEMLLWDAWGAAHNDDIDVVLIDDIAELLVRADAGDVTAEHDLYDRYRHDDRLRPGEHVTTYAPYGSPPRTTDLTQKR